MTPNLRGTTCPECFSVVKTYKRSLNAGMVRALIAIVKEYLRTNDWVDIRTISVRGGDYGKLAHFGLLVAGDGAGFWKPTQLGIDFVLHRKAAPKYALVDRGRCVGLASEKVSVVTALGKKFDYQELMGGFSPYSPQQEMLNG